MNKSERFTSCETEAAIYLFNQAIVAVRSYSAPDDRAAAQVAVLRAAIALAGGSCDLDRLAVLEREHAEMYSELVKLRAML